jgi:sugar O-acyltransferase (sialic acid O-acetyltransferase NeuD family)
MKDIAIYGAGGLGRETMFVIEKINKLQQTWNVIGFFDDEKVVGDIIAGDKQILGGIEKLNEWEEELAIVLSFGNPDTIFRVRDKITNSLITFPNIIYPDLWLTDVNSFSLGIGNVIQGGCIFSCDVSIGNFNLFNGFANLGHDVKIGSYNTFMPAVRISGGVTIGNKNLFGVSSIVLQQLKIDEGVVLSPGSVLLHKPQNNSTYIGNPAKLLKY